jgi:excisionase family DNA binding protein
VTSIPPKPYFKPWEVAKLLDVPLRTVQHWLQIGRLKGERRGLLGHSWMIPRAELERLASQK